MSPADKAYWRRAQLRASGLTPELASAMLRAFQIIRESLTEAQLTRIVSSGQIDELFRTALTDAVLERAFLPVRERIRSNTMSSVKYFARDLPKGGKVDGVLAVSFDVLNPDVVKAVRALDTKVVQTLQGDVKETVRAFVENGLRDGAAPSRVAREIRDVVGLAPHQEVWVRNLRTELESGNISDASRRALLDKRFNLDKLAEMSPSDRAARIDKIVERYRSASIAQNAATNAKTAALDAQKLGQRLSWQDAIEKGIVDGDRLMKRWVGVKDDRERPEHLAMEGEVVPFDAPFSNGEVTPGESTYNCRCISVYFQASK